LEVTEPGDAVPRRFAPDADLRTDLPRYRIWRNGELSAEPTDILDLWREDFVSCVIGCSFTFETALMNAGLPVRHIEENVNVPMFRTSIPCQPAGKFAGPMVVSMRPLRPADAIKAIEITSRYPMVHGAPIHLGDPEAIGIADISDPDFGDPVSVHPNEIPVFWACGVTPSETSAIALRSALLLIDVGFFESDFALAMMTFLREICRLAAQTTTRNASGPASIFIAHDKKSAVPAVVRHDGRSSHRDSPHETLEIHGKI
jgi:uncharacterized protein YcsI (UPF0317 family)